MCRQNFKSFGQLKYKVSISCKFEEYDFVQRRTMRATLKIVRIKTSSKANTLGKRKEKRKIGFFEPNYKNATHHRVAVKIHPPEQLH